MAKPTTDAAPADNSAVKAAASVPLTLDEFCSRISETDRRVELIGAFAGSETRAGHVKDAFENFASRFQTFINKPA